MRLKLLSLLWAGAMLAPGLAPAPLFADDLPQLGDPSQAVISPQQEREIGEQSMLQIRGDKTYLGDAEVNDYLNWLGDRLVAASSEPGLDFEFFALNNHDINAFALPGGFVGVNTGLILDAQTESELAAVLAHEVTHVTQHHLARMMAGQKLDTLASMAAAAIAIIAARNGSMNAGPAILMGPAAQIQRQLNFTREHEQEADRIGLLTLEKAGFDAHAMPEFFKRLQKDTTLLEGNVPSWLRTHPQTPDRIADIDSRLIDVPFRLVPDSLDFQLVRSKLVVLDKGPQAAMQYFSDALGPRKFGNPVAQRYGLTLALLENGDASKADRQIGVLLKQPGAAGDPMVMTLAGQIYRANGMSNADLLAFYRKAVDAHPHHRALTYDYAAALIAGKRYDAALSLLDSRINDYPDDARLYELEARIYAVLDKPQEEHHALAYAYISRGNLMGAIDQLTLAKQSGNDYYQLSVIDNELKQFRAYAAAQAHAAKNGSSQAFMLDCRSPARCSFHPDRN
jgi:beta-barrel assembly-enhancing protease